MSESKKPQVIHGNNIESSKDGVGIHIKDTSRGSIISSNIIRGGIVIGDDSHESKNTEVFEGKISIKTQKNWYQKPIGIVVLGVATIIIGSFFIFILNHFFHLNLG